MPDPDLFAEPPPPKTCGTCGACEPTRLGPTGTFCDLSLLDIKAEGPACGWWYPRAKA
jgi:hypothetical protein